MCVSRSSQFPSFLYNPYISKSLQRLLQHLLLLYHMSSAKGRKKVSIFIHCILYQGLLMPPCLLVYSYIIQRIAFEGPFGPLLFHVSFLSPFHPQCETSTNTHIPCSNQTVERFRGAKFGFWPSHE